MNHIAEKFFKTGTWFTTGMVFANEFFTVDFAFKVIISIMSFTLLLLQIGNQWAIRKKRKGND